MRRTLRIPGIARICPSTLDTAGTLLKLLALSVLAAPLGPTVSRAQAISQVADCQGSCAIAVKRVARIGEDVDVSIRGIPYTVASDGRNRVYVIEQRNLRPSTPVLVFSPEGKFLRRLGAYPGGLGPGELAQPYAILAGLGDTLRIIEQSRVITLNGQFQHLRTQSTPRTIGTPVRVVGFSEGLYLATGTERDPRNLQARLHFISTRLSAPSTIDEEKLPDFPGTERVIGPAADPKTRHAWVVQYGHTGTKGYQAFSIDSTSNVSELLQTTASWWMTQTRVIDVREYAGGILAVLVAQPKSDWREVEVNPRTGAGRWRRYESLLQLIDLRAGRVIGRESFVGYPRALLTNFRVATYGEEDDIPYVDLWSFTVPRR